MFVCCIEGFVFLELVVLQTNSTEACMVHISALRSSDFVLRASAGQDLDWVIA